MKTLTFEDREQWLAARLCKITGSRLKDIIVKRGTGKKVGFYELIAERIGLPADGENPMDRGTRLEAEAVQRFETMTGKKVDTSLVLWMRDENENIAISPDAFVAPKKGQKVTEALEVKCLGSARHIEAVLTNAVPDEYHYQVIQYFLTNDDLKILNLVMYDPRLKVRDFHIIEVKREQVAEEVAEVLEYERNTLREVEDIVAKLMEF